MLLYPSDDNIFVSYYISLCNNTGLRWGGVPRKDYFFRPPGFALVETLLMLVLCFITYRINDGGLGAHLVYRAFIRSAGDVEAVLPNLHGGVGRPRPAPPVRPAKRHLIMGVTFGLCFAMQLLLKLLRPRPFLQVSWMVMPCHLLTLLWTYIFTKSYFYDRRRYEAHLKSKAAPVSSFPGQRLYLGVLAVCYQWGPITAAMWPDWEDHYHKTVEMYFFIFHHTLLIIVPLLFVLEFGLPRFSLRIINHAALIAIFINCSLYAVLSRLAGLNINYYLSPPSKLAALASVAPRPTPEAATAVTMLKALIGRALGSQYYRWYTITALYGVTIGLYQATRALHWCLRAMMPSAVASLLKEPKRH